MLVSQEQSTSPLSLLLAPKYSIPFKTQQDRLFRNVIFPFPHRAVSSTKGIQNTLMTLDDGSLTVAPSKQEDQLGLVANLQPVITICNELSKRFCQ